jgi:hypothetical protein
MKIGQTLNVADIWSVTGESCQVTIIDIDREKMAIYIKYSTGYCEWLPISAFEGY